MYIVIMAGGSGTRLWPVSRRESPKQFQKLLGDQSLIAATFDRLRPLAEPHEIFVSTTRELAEQCLDHLPELPGGNVLIEPVGRNTGPAVGYAAAFFDHVNPDEIVATVHSDHVVGRGDVFCDAIRLAADRVRQDPDVLLTIGLKPTWGNPGFGYIKAAGQAADALAVLPVERFEEKPAPEVAQRYYESGEYFWNAGYFVFRAGTMLAGIERYDEELHDGLRRIQAALGTPRAADVLDHEYRRFAPQAIDQLVFEPESRAGRVATVPADLDWDDLGSWKTLRDILAKGRPNGVVTRGEVIEVECRDSLIQASGGRLIAVLGLAEMIVIDTPDALLICGAGQAEAIKEILARLPEDDPRR